MPSNDLVQVVPGGIRGAPAKNHLLMRVPWRGDPPDLVDLVESLPADSVAIDCGANVGDVTAALARRLAGRRVRAQPGRVRHPRAALSGETARSPRAGGGGRGGGNTSAVSPRRPRRRSGRCVPGVVAVRVQAQRHERTLGRRRRDRSRRVPRDVRRTGRPPQARRRGGGGRDPRAPARERSPGVDRTGRRRVHLGAVPEISERNEQLRMPLEGERPHVALVGADTIVDSVPARALCRVAE